MTTELKNDLLFGSRFNVGAHISFSRELYRSLQCAITYGMYSFQFFLGSNKPKIGDARSVLSKEDVAKTLKLQKHYPTNIFSHLPYTYNLCGNCTKSIPAWGKNGLETKRVKQTIEMIEEELAVLAQFNTKKKVKKEESKKVSSGSQSGGSVSESLSGCVLHLGSFKGGDRKGKGKKKEKGSLPESDPGLEAAVKSINNIEFPEGSMLLLENMTSGTKLCKNFEEMQKIWSLIDESKKPNLGWCIDTAHIHGEGEFDLGTRDGVDRMFHKMDRLLGLENVKLFHINDSAVRLGSEVDKHQAMGTGYIWNDLLYQEDLSSRSRLSCMSYFLDRISSFPGVLETWKGDMLVLQSV